MFDTYKLNPGGQRLGLITYKYQKNAAIKIHQDAGLTPFLNIRCLTQCRTLVRKLL